MAQTRLMIFSFAAIAGLLTAVVLIVRMTGATWGSIAAAVTRLTRSEDDRPHFELLMQ